MNFKNSFILALILSAAVGVSPVAAKERQYRLTLVFSDPDFKWSRVIEYRDDFHLLLDVNPFPSVHDKIDVAGVVYPKNGNDFVSVTVGTSQPNMEIGDPLGSVIHLKLPKDGRFEIPPVGAAYKKCLARVEFLP